MCGINGFLTFSNLDNLDFQNILIESTNTLSHRGPDSSGIWFNKDSGIYVGHRRLSIVDLSPSGFQPMVSNNENLIICLNGEIYNHLDLREELNKVESIKWKGFSDTETLINCFETWGIELTLRKTEGMFALALWVKGWFFATG